MDYKSFIKIICIFTISIIAFIFCFQVKYKNYVVPGTVFSKNTEQYVHGKYVRNKSIRYIMCVKPDDTSKFKHYSLYVDYATYCTHNVGDKIAFSVSEDKCIRDFKSSIWVEKISKIMCILIVVLCIILYAIIIDGIMQRTSTTLNM